MNEPVPRGAELSRLLGVARKLYSFDGERIRPTTSKAIYARDMYDRLVLHLGTADSLLSEAVQHERPVDVTVLAAVARMAMEQHRAFRYFFQRGISASEFEFRIQVYGIHHTTEVNRILEGFGLGKGIKGRDSLARAFVRLNAEHRLRKNRVFMSLDAKRQRELLKGKRAFHWQSDASDAGIPLSPDVRAGIYKLFSNSIHPFELGLMNYMRVTEYDHLDFEGLLFLCVEVILIYCASIAREYTRLRRKMATCLSKEEKAYLNELVSKYRIGDWILHRKWHEENVGLHGHFLSQDTNDIESEQ